jgi:hypothetical protein
MHNDPAGAPWDLPDGAGDDQEGTLPYYVKRRNEPVCPGSTSTVTETCYGTRHNKVCIS